MGLLESIWPGKSNREAETSRAVGARVDCACSGDHSKRAPPSNAAAAWHRPDQRLPPDKQFPPGTVRSPVYLRFFSNVSSMSYAVMSGCSGVTEAYPAITAS